MNSFEIAMIRRMIERMSETQRQVDLRQLLHSWPDTWLTEVAAVLKEIQAGRNQAPVANVQERGFLRI